MEFWGFEDYGVLRIWGFRCFEDLRSLVFWGYEDYGVLRNWRLWYSGHLKILLFWRFQDYLDSKKNFKVNSGSARIAEKIECRRLDMVSSRERTRQRRVTHCDDIKDKLGSSRNSSLGCGDRKRYAEIPLFCGWRYENGSTKPLASNETIKYLSLEYFLFGYALALPSFRISIKMLPENLLLL